MITINRMNAIKTNFCCIVLIIMLFIILVDLLSCSSVSRSCKKENNLW